MINFLLPVLIGMVTGALSACGLGGGTLLLLYLVEFSGLTQIQAQGVNLLFFLPMAVISCHSHKKSGFIDPEVKQKGILGGLLGVVFGTFLSQSLPMDYLRKGFSLLLLLFGSYTLYLTTKVRTQCPQRPTSFVTKRSKRQ